MPSVVAPGTGSAAIVSWQSWIVAGRQPPQTPTSDANPLL